MHQKHTKHLNYGKLVALSHPQSTLNKDSVAMLHLTECPHCEDTYKYLVNYSNNVLNSQKHDNFEAFDISTCPDTDMDYLSLFLTFLNNGLSKEHAANLFKHLNSCYSCFEKFVINWTAYVSVKMN